MTDYKIVLASASPRRKEILEKIGLEFDICPSDKEEVIKSSVPEEVCAGLSRQKALDVASQIKQYNEEHTDITSPQDILVIGADTIVAAPGEGKTGYDILGKPSDENDAFRMLKLLQDRTHTVYTGVTFVFINKDGRAGEYSFFEETKVTFYPVSDDEITEYIDSGEPMDKAGSYGVQGAFLKHIKKIDGDFYNVMGLPAARLYQELKGILNG